MFETMNQSEAVGVLCLLMVGADDEVRMEEISTMINNPFFREFVAYKIGPHKKFLAAFKKAKQQIGESGLEKRAIKIVKSAYPAFQLKTLAMMTLIAGADDNYAQAEKELMARVATGLGVAVEDVNPELEKMREAIRKAGLSKHHAAPLPEDSAQDAPPQRASGQRNKDQST